MACVFCAIIEGTAPASIIYRDDLVIAFMTIHPSSPGECTVIPLAHVDHFTDVEDDTAERIMRVAQRIGRRMREVFHPERVGMVVHGYGVAHAHLILVPQHGPHDITSARFAQIQNGEVVFTVQHIVTPERHVLDEHARLLSGCGDPEQDVMARCLCARNSWRGIVERNLLFACGVTAAAWKEGAARLFNPHASFGALGGVSALRTDGSWDVRGLLERLTGAMYF